jgi:hypothetical protein
MDNLNYKSLLQYHIETYMDNGGVIMLKAEQKGRPIKSVASRLKGMTGRRGDFTIHTVVTSDPQIKKIESTILENDEIIRIHALDEDQEFTNLQIVIVPEKIFIDL